MESLKIKSLQTHGFQSGILRVVNQLRSGSERKNILLPCMHLWVEIAKWKHVCGVMVIVMIVIIANP